ncbi:MAG: hypothetical protein JSU63_12575 [Phycisphaerales bacterium]|nr:MAG: hypothetical protein JSU63_12575 [Phycisphaerales bacterium]
MNERKGLRRNALRLWLIGFALAMLIAPGCISDDPSVALSNLASDLARQIVTWWLL